MSWWRHHVIILIAIATFYILTAFRKRYDWRITMLDVDIRFSYYSEKRGRSGYLATLQDTLEKWWHYC